MNALREEIGPVREAHRLRIVAALAEYLKRN